MPSATSSGVGRLFPGAMMMLDGTSKAAASSTRVGGAARRSFTLVLSDTAFGGRFGSAFSAGVRCSMIGAAACCLDLFDNCAGADVRAALRTSPLPTLYRSKRGLPRDLQYSPW